MSATDLTTMEGRTVAALHEALAEVGTDPDWIRQTARIMLMHTAAELVAMEQHAGIRCTLQDAVAYLCHAAEGRA